MVNIMAPTTVNVINAAKPSQRSAPAIRSNVEATDIGRGIPFDASLGKRTQLIPAKRNANSIARNAAIAICRFNPITLSDSQVLHGLDGIIAYLILFSAVNVLNIVHFLNRLLLSLYLQ